MLSEKTSEETMFKDILIGAPWLIGGAAAVILYDVISGYSVADFLKDFFVRLFGKAKSLAEARVNRLESTARSIKAKAAAKLQQIA